MNNKIKIAFTGHRRLKFAQVESMLNKIHAEFPDSVWIAGGAIGLDSHAAKYAMLHGIELWLILPFPPAVMTAKWNAQQKSFLGASIKYASKLSILSPAYNVRIYQDRNIRMVDLSDMLAAFWDGSKGGTGNCVGYARSIGKKMVRFSDFTGVRPQEEASSSSSSSYREVHGDIFTSNAEAMNNKTWYIIPLNESTGLKELRVSKYPYSYSQDGPRSSVRIDGTPIEDMIFKSKEEAYKAIPIEFYP